MELLLILIALLQVITLLTVLSEKGVVRLRTREALVDTCALIDGRILELAKSGFLPANIIIPKCVIEELQGLADGSDHQKRQRARYGLTVVQDLKDSKKLSLRVKSFKTPEAEVDDRLVFIAKKRQASLFTIDYNLQKVAEIAGVNVLNVNELSQLLRPVALPGEKLSVKIMQKGAGRNQGVGYLEDGTMVVVEDASKSLKKTLDVTVTRHLQTTAGRMLFATKTASKKRSS